MTIFGIMVMTKKCLKFLLGLFIIMFYYYASLFFIKIFHITFPPAIFALILFAFSLTTGIIKKEWVEETSKFFLNNMAILFVPFIVGLVVYKNILLQNWFAIMLVVVLTTTLTIVITGLFVEYGIKLVRLSKIRRQKND